MVFSLLYGAEDRQFEQFGWRRIGTAQKLCQGVFPPLNRQGTQVVAINLDQIERAEYGSVVMAPVAQEVEDRQVGLLRRRTRIQAIVTTVPDLPPEHGIHPSFRAIMSTNGMVRSACWLGLICSDSCPCPRPPPQPRVHRIPQALDVAYPVSTAINLILDDRSAHISKETGSWVATRPSGRFEFTFTPIHSSWLNLIEGFFSKFACSVLRHVHPSRSSGGASWPVSRMSIAGL